MKEKQQPSNRPENGGRKELGVERTTAPVPGTLLSAVAVLEKMSLPFSGNA